MTPPPTARLRADHDRDEHAAAVLAAYGLLLRGRQLLPDQGALVPPALGVKAIDLTTLYIPLVTLHTKDTGRRDNNFNVSAPS
jgi:hypothetical protein